MDLSIIVVNWNSARFAAECVASIAAETGGLEYEVIIVDNGSTDNSCQVLGQLRGVRLIRNQQNLGFARANNLGFESAQGRILLFLNPDTELRGPAVHLMYAALDAAREVGVLGCRLLNSDLSIQTSCVQARPTLLNQALDSEWLRRRFPSSRLWGTQPLFEESKGTPVEVDMVSGACLMVRRKAFEQVGRFDTDYFMYGEDTDLCYRVKKAGWKIAYLGRATVIHFGGQSSKQQGREAFTGPLARQSLYTFFLKTRGTLYARLYQLATLAIATFRLIILAMARLLPAPVSRQEQLRGSRQKWRKILRWAAGLEPWTRRMGQLLAL